MWLFLSFYDTEIRIWRWCKMGLGKFCNLSASLYYFLDLVFPIYVLSKFWYIYFGFGNIYGVGATWLMNQTFPWNMSFLPLFIR